MAWAVFLFCLVILYMRHEGRGKAARVVDFVAKWLNIRWRLDLADTDLAENLDLKDTLQKIWATIFYF